MERVAERQTAPLCKWCKHPPSDHTGAPYTPVYWTKPEYRRGCKALLSTGVPCPCLYFHQLQPR